MDHPMASHRGVCVRVCVCVCVVERIEDSIWVYMVERVVRISV